MPSKNLTAHFTRYEFACKCGCGICNVDAALLTALERFRVWLDKPVRINSGCRCAPHNLRVGGEPKSLHIATLKISARAVDISVGGLTALELMRRVEAWEYGVLFTGRGLYPDDGDNFIHLDVGRFQPARWVRRDGVYRKVERFV